MENKLREKIHLFLERHPDLQSIARCVMNLYFYRRIFGYIYENYIIKKHPEYKDLIKQNIEFKEKYTGKRCFIIGNGPSLKNIDFSLLENEYTFTVNQLPKNPNFPKLKTNFHIWSDARFFDINKNNSEDLELLNTMKSVNTDNNKPIVFYEILAIPMIKQFNLDKNLNIKYFIGNNFVTLKDKKIDFTSWTPNLPTVVQHAICLAVYMGFSKIYLLGIDCTSIINVVNGKLKTSEKAQYTYNISYNEKKRLEKIASMTSIRSELYSNLKLFDFYQEIYNYCEKYNVKLYNATNPTLLECIPKVDLEYILNNKH